MTDRLRIDRCTAVDFQTILSSFGRYWDDDDTRPRHHPMFVHEFGDTALVIRDGAVLAAYLFGFLAQTAPVAYVHMVAVHRAYRRRGLARRLYARFINLARHRGCRQLKATAAPRNRASIAFHRSLGMELEGEPNAAGVPVVADYAGPGLDRVVFRMRI